MEGAEIAEKEVVERGWEVVEQSSDF